MTITEMRNYIGISRAEFSRRYNIPLRTLESWEAGVRTPPEYVLDLLEESVRRTDIIEVSFVYDTLLQEGRIYPWSKDLDLYGADQSSYMTILSTVDKFRERYPNCEWGRRRYRLHRCNRRLRFRFLNKVVGKRRGK